MPAIPHMKVARAAAVRSIPGFFLAPDRISSNTAAWDCFDWDCFEKNSVQNETPVAEKIRSARYAAGTCSRESG